jgi:transcriptional regulator with XRE-family HTH domain
MALGQKSTGKGFHDPRYRALIEQLVAERKQQGLSQQALAERLGRHQQFVSRYEIGERRLDVVEFIDVAKALGLDPAKLISQ